MLGRKLCLQLSSVEEIGVSQKVYVLKQGISIYFILFLLFKVALVAYASSQAGVKLEL